MPKLSHKRTKLLCIIIIVILASGTLFATGKSEAKDESQPNLPTEVTFWHYSSGLLGQAMTHLINEFNATIGLDQGIVVREVYQGKATDVATKLRANLQANRAKELPDLAQLDATGVMDVRDSSSMVPVETLVNSDQSFSLNELQPGTVLSMTYKGTMIGMPFNASTILLYYNKDAFKEAGLDPSVPPKTLQELAVYSRRLVKKSADGKNIERYGFMGVPTTYELVSWIGQQNGVSYLTDQSNGHDGDPTKVVFDSDGTMATFLDAWRGVYESGGLGNYTSDVRQQFIAGKAAMFVASTSSLTTVIEAIGGRFELGVGPLPQVNEEATSGVNIGGGAIFVFDNGNDPQKKGTWEFLKFLMSAESQLYWHQQTGYFPVNMGTYSMLEFKEHLEKNPLFRVPIDQLQASDPRIQSVWWPNSYQAYFEIQNSIIKMLEKNISTQETVKKLATTLNQYIADYHKMNQQ